MAVGTFAMSGQRALLSVRQQTYLKGTVQMTIADRLANEIFKNSDIIPEEVLLFDTEKLREGPDLEVFSFPEPDCGDDLPQHPVGISISLLGSYQHRGQTGVISLYRNNIETYWFSLLRHVYECGHAIYGKDAKNVLKLITASVYEHEKFHYTCDFCHRLFGTQHELQHEEALAVARTWHWASQLGDRTFMGQLPLAMKKIVVEGRFRYRSPGYRDWEDYRNVDDFYMAVTRYVHPGTSFDHFPMDMNFGKWIVDHVPDPFNGAWTEQIV